MVQRVSELAAGAIRCRCARNPGPRAERAAIDVGSKSPSSELRGAVEAGFPRIQCSARGFSFFGRSGFNTPSSPEWRES